MIHTNFQPYSFYFQPLLPSRYFQGFFSFSSSSSITLVSSFVVFVAKSFDYTAPAALLALLRKAKPGPAYFLLALFGQQRGRALSKRCLKKPPGLTQKIAVFVENFSLSKAPFM